MVNDRLATPQGMAWLTVVTDPFHDSEVSCSGYPDISTSRSLVQTFTQTVAISKPPAVTTETWDCHTFFNPCTPPVDLTDALGDSGRFYLTDYDLWGRYTATGAGLGLPRIASGVNAIPMAAGNSIYSADSRAVSGLAPPINSKSGPFRLIAVGYEVVNTTAEIYKQGSVTVYKSPSGYNHTNLTTQTGPASTNAIFTELCTSPPATQGEAALYPNSRTWEAKEGVYMIPTMTGPANFITPIAAHQSGMTIVRGSPNVIGRAWLPLQTMAGANYPAGNDLLPFDVSGAIFTGLNALSTLQVTVRYVFERIPSIAEPDLLVLTRVPCPYDPMVLEIYSRVMAQMPPGCMVKENPLGEWFREILNVVAKVAPMIGAAVGNFVPGAALVGRVVGAAAGAGGQAVKRANVPRSPMAPQGKVKGPKQKQNPPGTGKRAMKKKAAQKQ